MKKSNSQHILNTSSNLLGFCLIVLTSLKITKINEMTTIDEFTGIACVFLITASLFSFLSIRSDNERFSASLEKIADSIFLVALFIIFVITIMIAFSIIF